MKEFATFLEEHGDIINEYYSRIVHEIDIPRQTDKKTGLAGYYRGFSENQDVVLTEKRCGCLHVSMRKYGRS